MRIQNTNKDTLIYAHDGTLKSPQILLYHAFYPLSAIFNLLSANPTKWSNILKQFVGKRRRIFWVCLTILWGWRLKGLKDLADTFITGFFDA